MDLDSSKLKEVNMGGTGTMYTLESQGRTWIYKPAESKWGHNPEPFRGIVQECAYEVQKIVDPESAIICKYIDAGNLQGSIQEFVPNVKGRNYHDMQYDESIPFTQDEINQFMREFVTDYLLCNYDGHGRNFITDENGIIRGVDKEQSFRYLREAESSKPSITYSPNTDRYGETEPIYNTIFRRYSEGKLDIDFKVLSGYMDRVEAVDRDQYAAIFSPYCESCSKAFGTDASQMLDQIVSRRDQMRTNIESFFQNLTEVRQETTGKKR